MSRFIEEGEYYARNMQEVPVGDCLVVSNNGLYISLEEEITVEIPVGDFGDCSFETITLSACLPEPLDLISLAGSSEIRIKNNMEGAIENIAKIAATTFGFEVLNHLIKKKELYRLVSVFFTLRSSYNPDNNKIRYVGDPLYNEFPLDGGALNSMIAMGHEIFHAYDHSRKVFNNKNAKNRRYVTEPRAVSFENYLRNAYSISPYRNQYTLNGEIIKDFYHKFGGGEKITGFKKLDNNSEKTSYSFSYTKTITEYKNPSKKIGNLPILEIERTTSSNFYIIVTIDNNKSVSFTIFTTEDEYKKETQEW